MKLIQGINMKTKTQLSVFIVLVAMLALVPHVTATSATLNANNWTNIDSVKNQAGDSFILNSTFFCGANTTCTYHANGSITISSTGGSVSGMSNPATADLNMGNYNITGLAANESYSYLIWTDGTNYYSKNGSTGKIDYSGANISNVMESSMGAGNKKIYIKSANYNMTSNITIPSYTELECEAPQGSSITMFLHYGFNLNGGSGQVIKNCNINPDSGMYGIFSEASILETTIDGVYVTGGKRGFYSKVSAIKLRIERSSFSTQSQYGVWLDTSGGATNNAISIIKSDIRQSGEIGLYLKGSAASTIKGNVIESNNKIGLYLNTVFSSDISNNYFESNNATPDCTLVTGYINCNDIYVGVSTYNVNINNNYFVTGANPHVLIETSDSISFIGNYCGSGVCAKTISMNYPLFFQYNRNGGTWEIQNAVGFGMSSTDTVKGIQYYNSTANIQQIYTGSAWDWFLMPSKVFGGDGILATNPNNGSVILNLTANARDQAINFVISNGTNVIGTGIKGDVEIPFSGTIIQSTALADQSGSINVSWWKDTYANYPPTSTDLLGYQAISGATKAQSTGLSQTVAAGDLLRFNVESASTITRVTISLTIRRT